MSETNHDAIRAYYNTLFSAWGRQHWWPAHSRLEMIVGAYLTQNTSWTNVEKALRNLRKARLLTINGIRRTPQQKLEQLIRPAGYFRQKAQRLKTFVRFLDERYGGSFERMFAQPTAKLRDSSTGSYDEIRQLFEQALGKRTPPKESLDGAPAAVGIRTGAGETVIGPRGSSHRPSRVSTAERTALVQAFNEMHGLIVGVGKTYCLKSQPQCDQCPLQKFLPEAK